MYHHHLPEQPQLFLLVIHHHHHLLGKLHHYLHHFLPVKQLLHHHHHYQQEVHLLHLLHLLNLLHTEPKIPVLQNRDQSLIMMEEMIFWLVFVMLVFQVLNQFHKDKLNKLKHQLKLVVRMI
jgi:hypothetical protein